MREVWPLLFFLSVPFLILLAFIVALVRLSDRVRRLEEAQRRGTIPTPTVPPVPAAPPPKPPIPVAPPLPIVAAPSGATRRRDAEQWVGGTWLQNIGSLLLLLGVFFLLLWSYRTGRMGPAGLVVAGVLTGAVFAWRGDRVARTLPAFGHALVGIGIGAAYLSLHVGHFVLDVYGPIVAYPLLALASFAAILAGLRYKVQVIAFLGVAGAFVPWIAAILTGIPGASMSAPALLGYLVLVDAGVWFLAARAGWSGLALTALLLTAMTWITVLGRAPWSTPVELGLAALFVGLGLAALPRAVERGRDPSALDLAVVALAPYALLVASWPWLAATSRPMGATVLFALAAVYAGAALWIDRRRERRDLWSLLAFAAAAFVAGGLERAAGTTFTPLAWCVQGVVLIALGLWPRAGVLRLAGYFAGLFGVCFGLPALFSGLDAPAFPVFTAASLRSLVVTAAALLAAHLLARHADRLRDGEREAMPFFASAGANALLATWAALHAWRIVRAFEVPGFPDTAFPDLSRTAGLTAATVALLWLGQGLAIVTRHRDRFALRVPGYALAGFAALSFFIALSGFEAWDALARGPLHALMATTLAALLLGLGFAEWLSRHRTAEEVERRVPEVATLVVHVLWLTWSVAAAGSIARAVAATSESTAIVAAGLASAAWLTQAIVLFTQGWRRGSPFLRWVGLATFGLTILKFMVLDLSRVDGFWRFVTAIAVGVALLVVSYVYQQARRSADASGLASPPAPATLRPHDRPDDRADPPRP